MECVLSGYLDVWNVFEVFWLLLTIFITKLWHCIAEHDEVNIIHNVRHKRTEFAMRCGCPVTRISSRVFPVYTVITPQMFERGFKTPVIFLTDGCLCVLGQLRLPTLHWFNFNLTAECSLRPIAFLCHSHSWFVDLRLSEIQVDKVITWNSLKFNDVCMHNNMLPTNLKSAYLTQILKLVTACPTEGMLSIALHHSICLSHT